MLSGNLKRDLIKNRYKGSVYYLVARPGAVEVKMQHFFSPSPAANGVGGNSSITSTLLNGPRDFAIRWNADGGGTLKFVTLNSDGAFVRQSLTFGPLVETSFPDPYQSTEFSDSILSFDGNEIEPEVITFGKSCARP